MDKLNEFAGRQPFTFGFVMTVVFILMVFISSAVASAIWAAETYGWYLGSMIGRLVSIAILLLTLSGLGWLLPAGFTRLGGWRAWLTCLLCLVYWIPVSAYAVTGNLKFSLSDPALYGLLTTFFLVLSFLEEIVFRGLILYAFIRVWGETVPGILKSVLASSLLFGGMHVIYILSGTPLAALPLQMVETFTLGIFLGTLVLAGSSIYSAVFFHGIVNLAAFLTLQANSLEGIPASAWIALIVLMAPLAALGIYQLRGLAPRTVLPEPT